MPVRTTKLHEMKAAGERIPCVTAYDYPTARLEDAAGIPVILVGDSLGNVVLGYDTTLPVTMDDMVRHTQAVVRGAPNALVIADMPFMSYQASDGVGVAERRAAAPRGRRPGREARGRRRRRRDGPTHRRRWHPGHGARRLTPQSVNQLGGYRVQGATLAQAQSLMEDAAALEQAGAFAVVLEVIPGPLAEAVTKRLSIPTIGIGAGAGCDGQIQVVHDILGFGVRTPRHAKRYADLNAVIGQALAAYASDIRGGSFPTAEHTLNIDDAVLRELLRGAELEG